MNIVLRTIYWFTFTPLRDNNRMCNIRLSTEQMVFSHTSCRYAKAVWSDWYLKLSGKYWKKACRVTRWDILEPILDVFRNRKLRTYFWYLYIYKAFARNWIIILSHSQRINFRECKLSSIDVLYKAQEQMSNWKHQIW